ncbi:MAG TPA: hypothetical protein VHY56_09955 [Candidatus Binataceae bacterium]|nr:hypothetical protein [Candidatus Binataceae bacterium]
MIRSRLFTIAFASLLIAGLSVAADQPPPNLTRVKATVEQLEGQTLTAKTASGKEISLTLSPAVRVLRSKPATVADVKPGQFIGCTAVEGEDGKLHAKEIHILPESMRGVGEGHYPWGNAAKTTMTNGNIEQVAGVTDGQVIKVSYHGGHSAIDIPADVPVTTVEIVNRDRLKPGTPIILFARKNPDGSLNPQFISIVPAETK